MVVAVAGLASSGKSTLIKSIAKYFTVRGSSPGQTIVQTRTGQYVRLLECNSFTDLDVAKTIANLTLVCIDASTFKFDDKSETYV